MGGGPAYGGLGSAPIPIEAPPMQNSSVVHESCPNTPPHFQPPPEIPLEVCVLEPLSSTGQTTCRISLYSTDAFEKLGGNWDVPLISSAKHRFSIQTTLTRFHFTCTVLKHGVPLEQGNIGEQFATETVSRSREGFRVTLERDRDTTLLKPSIEKCSASEICPPSWRGSIQRALFHSEDGDAAPPRGQIDSKTHQSIR